MAISRPRTIQIFLPNGDPRGIRVAELTTSIVRVIEVPRSLLSSFMEMPESKQVGLYFLVGDDADKDFPSVYIGQSGGVGQRLHEHNKSKDFWNRALAVVSLTNSLTQTHGLYLEWLSIQQATEAGRFKMENGNTGSKPHTPPALEADCMDIYDTLRTLIATLGQPVFEPLAKTKEAALPDELYYLKSPAYEATAQYTTEGMVVMKGSTARKDLAASVPRMKAKRDALVADGGIVLVGDVYVFQRDILFESPSAAAAMVCGRSANGWASWKDKTGKTLDVVKRATA